MRSAGMPTAAAAAALAVGLMSGCGEQGDVVVYKQGKFQGKPDSKPWDSDPGSQPYTGSKWTRGDKSSWEAALRARNFAQNEYKRTQ